MRSVSLRLVDLERNPLIPLGFEGENEYTVVRIDCKKIFDEHPNAVPTWAVTPPEGDSYPAVVVLDGDIVSWTVCDSDLVYPGTGKFQLAFVIDETVIGKTYTARTKILDSINPSGEAPTPIQNWLTQAAAALQGLPQEVSDAVVALMGAMVGVGETLDPDENVTVTYDPDNNTLTIGVPKGKDGHDGQDGHTPAITAQKVGKVTTFYVDGVAIATVNDGQDGAGIDDTTKSTTSTWSSKKIDDENSALKTEINSKYTKPQTGIPASDLASGVIPAVPVQDVKLNGTSCLDQNGNANIPTGQYSLGLVTQGGQGVVVGPTGILKLSISNANQVKGGEHFYSAICPASQDASVFYGLAKVAGADMKDSANAVGVFTDNAKLKIQQMLGLWTPKFYSKILLEEDATDFGRYGNDFEDPTIEVWEELVVVLYQSIAENGQTIAANNCGTFYLRDAINDIYLANAGYIYGAAPVTICFRRYPNVLMVETTTNANTQVFSRSYPRSDDYVDKVRYLWLHCEGGSVKAGTTMEAYIHKFI